MSSETIIEKLKPLFKSIYKRRSGGCCLHGVIDDGNWDSIGDPEDKDTYKHKDCREAARLLAEMDYSDRERIRHDGGIDLRLEDEDDCCPHCGRGGDCR